MLLASKHVLHLSHTVYSKNFIYFILHCIYLQYLRGFVTHCAYLSCEQNTATIHSGKKRVKYLQIKIFKHKNFLVDHNTEFTHESYFLKVALHSHFFTNTNTLFYFQPIRYFFDSSLITRLLPLQERTFMYKSQVKVMIILFVNLQLNHRWG